MSNVAIVDRKVREYGHFISGRREPLGQAIDRYNPASAELTSRFADGRRDDCERAIAAARRGFDHGWWPRATAAERGDALNRWADLVARSQERLAQVEMAEVGKTISTARSDIATTESLIRQAAAAAYSVGGTVQRQVEDGEFGLAIQEPVGVAAAIIAWNYPSVLFGSKVPFALAAGCTTIVKPSILTTGSTMELAYLAVEAGIPGEAINVVSGTGPAVGSVLAESLDVDCLSFTGSTSVAAQIASTRREYPQKRTFELGGKGATIVFADADLDAAARATVRGFSHNQGQTCTAGTRLLVQSEVADEFIERVSALAGALRVGDPSDELTDLGPLVSEAQYESVSRFVNEALASGGVDRAARHGHLDAPWFAPAVLDNLEPDSAVLHEEVFGPVLAVRRFATEQEAVEIANATEYGLSNGVWTTSIERSFRMVRQLHSGTVWVNTVLSSSPSLPFGGVKASGFGREKGFAGVSEYLHYKSVYFGSTS